MSRKPREHRSLSCATSRAWWALTSSPVADAPFPGGCCSGAEDGAERKAWLGFQLLISKCRFVVVPFLYFLNCYCHLRGEDCGRRVTASQQEDGVPGTAPRGTQRRAGSVAVSCRESRERPSSVLRSLPQPRCCTRGGRWVWAAPEVTERWREESREAEGARRGEERSCRRRGRGAGERSRSWWQQGQELSPAHSRTNPTNPSHCLLLSCVSFFSRGLKNCIQMPSVLFSSQNHHRMVWVGRDLEHHLVPTPLP